MSYNDYYTLCQYKNNGYQLVRENFDYGLNYYINKFNNGFKKSNVELHHKFEYINYNIFFLFCKSISIQDRKIMVNLKWDNDFLDILYDNLIKLNHKWIIIWFLLHCEYLYTSKSHSNKLITLKKNMNYLKKRGKLYELNYFIKHPYMRICLPFYSLSYRNNNNKDLFIDRHDTYLAMCPDLYANYLNNRKFSQNGKIKIAFMSQYLGRLSSPFRDRIGLISNLPKDKFDVKIITFASEDKYTDKVKDFYNNNKELFVDLHSDDIESIRKKIGELNLDILFFCEIGMSMYNFLLSFSRLAPVQINTWGNSDTSGNKEIDYFVSSKYFEIEDAQNHYSEKLIKFNSLSTYYYRPSTYLNYKYDEKFINDLNIPENHIVLGCMQTINKISNSMELIFNDILNIPNTIILLSESIPLSIEQERRMVSNIKNSNRIIRFGTVNHSRFCSVISRCDIILDSYPFGGCNTSFECFDFNKPIVTYPTKYLNGRFTLGMYKKMGILDLIVNSHEEYILHIKKLIDDDYRNSIVEKIKDNKHKLFEDKESINEWIEFFESFRS